MSMGRSALMVAVALGIGPFVGVGSPTAQLVEKAAVRPQQPRQNKRVGIFGGGDGGDVESGPRRSRHGWSNRHVQRMATKKRNQARHRAACKGGGRS